jgi:acetyltransferase-like isoleucine patch superfamily enzyme
MNYEVIDREGMGGELILGDGSRIARQVSIDISGDVKIGKRVMISEGVLILTHEHDISDPMNRKKILAGWLNIGDNVYIGARVIICPQVRHIGRSAVIGAGSVVTHAIDNYEIVAGNPAKRIGINHGS